MILREWHGRASYGHQEAYPAHFRAHVVPELRHVPGFLGADLLRRDIGGRIEFCVITRWASMDAVRRFAGNDPTRAVVEQGAVDALSEFDERVSHYEVLESVAHPGIADRPAGPAANFAFVRSGRYARALDEESARDPMDPQ